jgi:hypothetical protein
MNRGDAVAPSRRTLAEVAEEFVRNFESKVAADERSPRTLERYRQHLEYHIIPALGRREIQKIGPNALAHFLSEKRREGLSAWSRKGIRRLVASSRSPSGVATSPKTRFTVSTRTSCRRARTTLKRASSTAKR